ncbi:MAG: TRAP transporter small permease subunit [Burkholderiales bacterium]|nr:TRAP transporter small permease subunit [Burkholderiales bacterium]
MNKIILAIDQLSKTVGHAFAWCIVILTLGTCYEVFMRYALNDPTSWAFDLSYLMYGAVFYMAGAYTLSRGGHVRADMFYRKWSVRTQAVVELVLYVLFFFPGILALVIAGGEYGFESMRIRESSVNSPAGVPIWPLKMMIQFGAGLIALQGLAEVLRCIVCLREGRWPARLHDVEELEQQILQEHARKAAAGLEGQAAAQEAPAQGAAR